MRPSSDLLAALAREASAALVSDAADRLGIRRTTVAGTFTGYGMETPTVVGLARPIKVIEVDEPPIRHYGQEIDFIDSLGTADVAVIVQQGATAACWGELFSAAAAGRGAAGAVVDGLVRDTRGIATLGFPVFARGARPSDSLGRVSMHDADEPVKFGGIEVHRGDMVVADADGITVVEAGRAGEVAERAIAKARIETKAKKRLLEGATLREVWERFRVL